MGAELKIDLKRDFAAGVYLSEAPSPLTTALIPSRSVAVSFKDDVTIILLLGVVPACFDS